MKMRISFSLLSVLVLVSSPFLVQGALGIRFYNYQAEDRHHFLGRARTKIFHPPTGLCVLRNRLTDPLTLGPCDNSDSWTYTPQNILTVKGTYYCLQGVGPHRPARLSIICTPSDSAWEILSAYDHGKTYFSTVLEDGSKVCLDVDGNDTVITNPCNGGHGVTGDRGVANDSQWFKFIQEPKSTVNELIG